MLMPPGMLGIGAASLKASPSSIHPGRSHSSLGSLVRRRNVKGRRARHVVPHAVIGLPALPLPAAAAAAAASASAPLMLTGGGSGPTVLADIVHAAGLDDVVQSLVVATTSMTADGETETVVAAIVTFMAIAAVASSSSSVTNSQKSESGMDEWASLAASEGVAEPNVLKVYDPSTSLEYFSRRPVTLLKRAWRSGVLLGALSFNLWLDNKLRRRPEDGEVDNAEKKRNETDAKRAAQLVDILIKLGPTYVKLGQVLSSRQDLLPPPYIERLRTLQDSVPPFDDAIARRIVNDQLGPSNVEGLRISDSPLASASLGQVYKGELDGKQVAVKVQRPGALVAVSLDVCIIRAFGPTIYKISDKDGNLDSQALIDEWGRRFIDELDYGLEARNGEAFAAAMRARTDELGQVVTAPAVVPNACTRRVLTTEWVDGCRLDESDADDVPRLCAVALSAYLCMLLDTNLLHVDPHPGNLLRTTDGRLCILDWGLVTDVTPQQSDAILQFIAHLVSQDYGKVDRDLVTMGFVAPEKMAALNDEGLTNAIATLFSALAAGGGAAGFRKSLDLPDEDELKELRKELVKIKDKEKRKEAFIAATGGEGSKVAQLSRDLEDVQKRYGNVFTIPSYFGYILRAFSVLEGIGLASDPSYSIANECYPFVARRLLTDRSEGTRKALEQLLYGADGPNATLSAERVQELGKAFETYTTTVVPPTRYRVATTSSGLPAGVREALKIALAPEGGPLQDILLREVVRITAAVTSDTLERAATAAFLPLGALGFQAPMMNWKTPRDDAALAAVSELQRIFDVGGGGGGGGGSSAVDPMAVDPMAVSLLDPAAFEAALKSLPSEALVRELVELGPELLPGAQAASLRLAAATLDEAARRMSSGGGGGR